MRRAWRSGAALASAMGLLSLVVLVGCASGGENAAPPGSSDQAQYVKRLLENREYLFNGYAATVTSVRIPVDDTYRLTVRVCGDRSGCVAGPSASVSPTPGGPTTSPNTSPSPSASTSPDTSPWPGTSESPGPSESSAPPASGEAVLRVGGMVRARLTSDMPGTMTPLGTDIQPVLTPEDRATWEWDLTPSQAGTWELQVHVSVLAADTEQPLIADQVITIPMRVDQTNAKRAERAWFGIKEVVGVLGAAGISLVAVIGFIARSVVKRRRARAAAAAAQQPPANP
jgi:hypothetical protein